MNVILVKININKIHCDISFSRYLASECTFTDLHFMCKIEILTASKIVRNLSRPIWSVIGSDCITIPKSENLLLVALKSMLISHTIGAVNGKHFRVLCPRNSGYMFYSYKGYYSVVLMQLKIEIFYLWILSFVVLVKAEIQQILSDLLCGDLL